MLAVRAVPDCSRRCAACWYPTAAAPTTPRQLIFATPAADVALTIQAKDEQLLLSGQVFPLGDEDATAYIVRLDRAGQPADLATTDMVGKFGFLPLPEGQYALTLTTSQHEIIIDPLEVALQATG